MGIRLLIILLPLVCSNVMLAQDAPAVGAPDAARVDKLTGQYVAAVGEKSDKVSKALDKSTQQYLDKLQKQEAKLQKRVAKVDSLAAHNIFASSASKYQQLQSDIKNRAARLQRSTGLYNPFTDTASASLKFLSNNSLAGKLPVNSAQLTDAMSKVHALEAQLKQAENVKEFIRQRKEYLKQQLASYNLGSGLKQYNSMAYYYSQQVNDYRAALKDETKAEQKALALLRRYAPFQNFMAKYGALAGLFNVPADYASTSMNGLQTVSQVQNLLNQRIAGMGPGGMQAVSTSISAAQSELSKLRNKFSGLGNTGDMPDFQPDANKTKPFKKRLVYGLDMTTVKSSTFFPLTTDVGVSIGYMATSRLTAGIGASYKIGWGEGINHIHISSQGIGLRSYIDWKLKKSFYLSGGMEFNYLSAFKDIKALQDYSAWQKSALLGLSKTVSLKSKFLHNTKVSLLYDFLHAMQIPHTQAIVFRAGYSF